MNRKGASQIDFAIAAGMFLLVFAFLIQFTTNYFIPIKDVSEVSQLRTQAFYLLDMIDRYPVPREWPSAINDNTTLLYLDFNNETTDRSIHGNTVTNFGANCSASVQGRAGSACNFDGVDDYVKASSVSLGSISGITFSAWIKPDFDSTDTNAHTVISWNNADSEANRIFLRYETVGTPRWIFDSDDCFRIDSSGVSFNSGEWHYIVATWDGDGKIYWDGVDVSSVVVDFDCIKNTDGEDVYIGKYVDSSPRYFDGIIDEVAIYNISLNANEVYEHYLSGLKRLGLKSDAYRFYILLNNTGAPAVNVNVTFNLTALGFENHDFGSVKIYNETNDNVPYFRNDDDNYTFLVENLPSGEQWYTVYFDDDSFFDENVTDFSVQTSKIDESLVKIYPVHAVPILSYRKIIEINNSDYNATRDRTDFNNSFRILIEDADTNSTIIDFGEPVIEGDVVSIVRYVLYQNSVGDIRNARITVQVW